MGQRELPKEIIVTEDFEVAERIGDGTTNATRILLSPSRAYLGDKVVQLERIIEAMVYRYNNFLKIRVPTLLQLHWQFGDRTEMRAQQEISSQEELKAWVKEVKEEHPLPEGASWLICGEKSKYFVTAVDK